MFSLFVLNVFDQFTLHILAAKNLLEYLRSQANQSKVEFRLLIIVIRRVKRLGYHHPYCIAYANKTFNGKIS